MNPPELRDDLKIIPLDGAEEGLFVIEDPLRNLFFKIGRREYLFLCLLEEGIDSDSFADDQVDPETYLSSDEALTLLKWLGAKQLLKNQTPEILQQIDRAEQQARRKAALVSRYNPIIFRVPLFNPDPWLNRLMPLLGWLAGPLFGALWIVLAMVSLTILFSNWNRFISQTEAFFSTSNLLIIALIWVVLKVLHELGHSVTCRRHGGRVYEIGILFILFIPLTYVNATSSWSFSSRWQRIHVGTAGMYMELFAAWCALVFWFFNMDSPTGQIAHQTVLIAGISSLLFNANPLMRFDGYYILSDLVKVPNLYFRGLAGARQTMLKLFFGASAAPAGAQVSPPILVYGFAVYLWRILVIVTLSVLASSLFGGWGLVLAAVAMGGWIYQIGSSLITTLISYRKQNPAALTQFVLRATTLASIGAFMLFGLSYRARLSAPAVIVFDQQEWVRTRTPGFIGRIHVGDGDLVEKGDLLIVLNNDDLVREARDFQLQIEAAELRKRQADAGGDQAAVQVLAEQLGVLRSGLEALQADLEALNIAAPIAGMAVGDIANRIGTFVDKGEELLQIIGPESKRLKASVSQDDISGLQSGSGRAVTIDMSFSGLGTYVSTVEEISPTASTRLVHFSLAAPFGGPLDVKRSGPGLDDSAYEYFLPRFSVVVELPEQLQQQTRSGQQALIRFRGTELPPGVHLWQEIKQWFEEKQNQA